MRVRIACMDVRRTVSSAS